MILKNSPNARPSRTLIPLGLALVLAVFAAACGGETDGAGPSGAGENGGGSSGGGESTAMAETTAPPETTNVLAGAEVGEDEIANMLPARGIKKEESRPLPENPPEGVRLYPASTNKLVEGDIDYPRSPPTNGNHNPFWQNCGFYDRPVMEEKAVHSLDHGVVWITYSPDLPQSDVSTLRDAYGTQPYVIVSPYPDQSSPVVATAWRVQLPLDSADDPRLSRFVDDFRVSELAPLSGNGCIKGSGEPVVSGPASYYEKG